MSGKQCVAVAPVFMEKPPKVPVDLGNGVRLDSIPAVYSQHRAYITKVMGEYHATTRGVAMVKEYTAESLYSEAEMNRARQAIQLAALSMWLAAPTDLSFCLVAYLSGDVTPVPSVFPVLKVPPGFGFSTQTDKTSAESKTINEALSLASTRTTAFVASRYLWLAIHEDAGDLMYGILSIAIEALFGPEDYHNLTKRIPIRGATLLGGDRAYQCLTHLRLQRWWTARCALMHGDTLADYTEADQIKLTIEVLALVRDGIRRVLLDSTVAAEFATFPGREAYLDRLEKAFAMPTVLEQKAAEAAR